MVNLNAIIKTTPITPFHVFYQIVLSHQVCIWGRTQDWDRWAVEVSGFWSTIISSVTMFSGFTYPRSDVGH